MRLVLDLLLFTITALTIAAIGTVVAEEGSVPGGTIYGHVFDADTKQPLSQAFVYCQEATCSKPTTDSTGYYATDPCFSPSQTYTIQCTRHGYKTATKSVKTDLYGKAIADFNLVAEGAKPSENQPPVLLSLIGPLVIYQDQNCSSWEATVKDVDRDTLYYRFLLIEGQEQRDLSEGWTTNNVLYPWGVSPNPKDLNPGNYELQVWVRDGNHAGPDSYDAMKSADFTIQSHGDELKGNATWADATNSKSSKNTTNGIISGQIINVASGAPIPRAKIAITDSSGYIYSGMADNNGYFTSSPIFSPLRAYDVICDTFGYTPNHQNVMTDASGNSIANIAISQEFEVNPGTCSKYRGNWQNGECIFVH